MENKKNGVLEFVLFIIAIILIFVVKNFLGAVLAVVSLIISIVKLKNKHILTIISLIGNTILIIYSVMAFIISFIFINNIISKARIDSYKNFESILEQEASIYIQKYPTDDKNVKITIEDLENNGMSHYDNGCTGYVMYNAEDNVYKAYIKCADYETEYNNDVSDQEVITNKEYYDNVTELERVFASDVVYYAELGRIRVPQNDEIIYITKKEFEDFLDEYNSNLTSSSAHDSPFYLSARYDCDGYVSLKVDNTSVNKYVGKAYVKCKGNYQTEGFDSNILE